VYTDYLDDDLMGWIPWRSKRGRYDFYSQHSFIHR